MQANNTPSGGESRIVVEGHGRGKRLWLLALLVLAALLTGALLLAKYQLSLLRDRVHAEIARRTGIALNTTGVEIHGIAGLRLQDLKLAFQTPGGPTVEMEVPEALLRVSLLELLRGDVLVDRLQLDDATIVLRRPPGGTWLVEGTAAGGAVTGNVPFRAVGRNCTLTIDRIVGDSTFTVSHLNFDLNRLTDSPHIIANIEGAPDQAPDRQFTAFGRYASVEDFDLRIQSSGLETTDVAAFFPAAAGLLASGSARPSIRVSGYPRKEMVVALELPFSEVAPANPGRFPVPSEGLVTALASYDLHSRLLTLNTAKTLSPGFEGRVEGTISLAGDLPDLALKLEVQQLPVGDIVGLVSREWLAQYGALQIEAPQPYKFFVTLNGPVNNAALGLEAQLGAGTLQFTPAGTALPRADLQFSLMSIAWDSETAIPRGSVAISGGTLEHGPSKLKAEDLSGTFRLAEDGLVLEPLVARLAGNTVMGGARYTLADKTLHFAISGNLGALEELEAVKNARNLTAYGPVAIDSLSGMISPGKQVFDASVDLTRAGVEWEWWLNKAPGIGARLHDLHVEITPAKSAAVAMKVDLDTVKINADAAFTHRGGGWSLDRLEARSDNVAMGTANKVLTFPYAISGGTGTGAYLNWVRKAVEPDTSEMTIGGVVDEATLLPAGSRIPVSGKSIKIDTTVTKKGEYRTGSMTIHAAQAELPPFGTPWLLPLRAADDPSMTLFPPLDRDWTYTLTAGTLAYPPWRGETFRGNAYTRKLESGFDSFEARIGEGKVGGLYRATRPDNVNNLNANWEKVPASVLLEHLKLPDIFTGTMTGGIQYAIDRDDSGTLSGTGYFDVVDGQFSADYLVSRFQTQLEQGAISIPPSLRFSRFTSDIALEGDVVKAANMFLQSEAVTISGGGQFVLSGDMDFHLKFSLPPETAKGIPALRTYFNLDGMKRSQTNLELSFHIFGPGFSPRMELDGMPSVGDTILSGAAEVTGDVMKVVDLPRQILLDLFKIGGGIVGAGGRKTGGE